MPYLLALDEGTTSARAIVFDETGAIRSLAQQEFKQHYPQPGWVEHDAEEIWRAQYSVAEEALTKARISAADIAGIGITNQRETAVLWDRRTGEPIAPAIVWQDRRTAPMCEALRAAGHEELIRTRTGLVIDAYFSATKIAWLLDNIPGARARAERGELAFGTIDTWLVWKLTGGAVHVTDASNASRTLLCDIKKVAWDDELLKLFNVPRSLLPEIRSSSEIYGPASVGLLGRRDIPIAGIAGDQQAALFGQRCFQPGQIKTTYGTGCFMLQNIGSTATVSQQRLLTTIAASQQTLRVAGSDQREDPERLAANVGTAQGSMTTLSGSSLRSSPATHAASQATYALEGSVFIGGAVVQWLRDGLGIIAKSSEVSALAATVPDSGGVLFVPAFAGLGAPHWDAQARGMMIGLTRGTTKAHIARAALEAIAFQVADLLEAMRSDSHLKIDAMRVDGGAANDEMLMQIQADLLGIPLLRPEVIETTALGAAYLAGLATGVWRDTAALAAQPEKLHRIEPRHDPKQAAAARARWQEAVKRAKNWAE